MSKNVSQGVVEGGGLLEGMLKEGGSIGMGEGGGRWKVGGRESVRLWTGGWQHISLPVLHLGVSNISGASEITYQFKQICILILIPMPISDDLRKMLL